MSTRVTIAIAAAALIAIAAYFAFGARSTEVVPGGQETAGPAAPVRPFEDKARGIGFDYPLDLELVRSTQEGAVVYQLMRRDGTVPPAGGEGPVSITVHLYPAQGRSLEAWLREDPESNLMLGNGELKATTVAGQDAFSYSWDGLYQGETTAFLRGDEIVAISVTYDDPADPLRAAYRTVLASFRLK